MKKRLTTLFTAGLMLASAVSLMPASAADTPDEIPGWLPDSLSSAIEFRNSYGAVHIQDGYICVVHESGNPQMSPRFEVDGEYAGNSESLVSLNTYYLYPEAADTPYYMVALFRPSKSGEMTISYRNEMDRTDYTFTTEDGDEITETDIYGWLPDCREEYSQYINSNGQVSVKDNYVVICTSHSAGTPYRWKEKSDGEECFVKDAVSDCSTVYETPLDGGTVEKIYTYKAVKDGYAKIQYDYGSVVAEDQVESSAVADCVVLNDTQEILLAGQMRTTLVDDATGELIEADPDMKMTLWASITYDGFGDSMEDSFTGTIRKNPDIIPEIAGHLDDDIFSFGLRNTGLPANYRLPGNNLNLEYYNGKIEPENAMTITKYDNGAADVVFRLTYDPSGDANGDGFFAIADAVVLDKWLLGKPDANIADWKQLDLCRDNKLNVFDLIAMKQKLVEIDERGYVEPEVRVEWGSEIMVVKDSIKMYQGPDLSYPETGEIPGAIIREAGYMKDNFDWIFVDFDGKFGWISVYDEDGNYNISWLDVADKPVIYLYPEEETDVHVELELTESELSTTYPRYNDGWDVVAYPDGTLLNKADGTHHRYLFWDAVNVRTRFDLSKGFCVAGADTEAFLKEKLTAMGLTESEMNEFIVYWLPRMEHNAYNLISFQDKAYTDTAKLNITPAPDSLLRVFMTYVPLDEEVEIEPQQFETFERKGFTAVEWGGCEIR